MTLRRANIIGRLGSDPEMKQVGDSQLATVGIATQRYNEDEPEWIEFNLWGDAASTFAEHASQGSYIRVEGQLELDEWDGGASLKVVARSAAEWTFMDSGGGNDGGGQQGGPPPPDDPKGPEDNTTDGETFDSSEIPF